MMNKNGQSPNNTIQTYRIKKITINNFSNIDRKKTKEAIKNNHKDPLSHYNGFAFKTLLFSATKARSDSLYFLLYSDISSQFPIFCRESNLHTNRFNFA